MCWCTISVKCNRYCDASLVSQTYLFLLLNEVRHVNSSFQNNLENSRQASIKWHQWQCADLNVQHSWHLESFDGMPYCNSRWDEETAKLRWLSEISKHAQWLQILCLFHLKLTSCLIVLYSADYHNYPYSNYTQAMSGAHISNAFIPFEGWQPMHFLW